MNRRIKGSWILAGFTALTAIFGSDGRPAMAGLSVLNATSSMIIDPQYQYNFQIAITASLADPFLANTDVSITGLTGFNGSSAANSTAPHWFSSLTLPGEVDYIYEGPTITTDVTYSLSQFYAGPTVQVPQGTPPPTPSISYAGTYTPPTGPSVGVGSGALNVTYVASVVPEPSSLVLLLAGSGVVPLVWGFRKRSQRFA